MCAMTRRGQVAEEEASCAKFLYVNRDFRQRPCVAESGEDGRKGWDEDMAMEVQESRGSSGGIIVKLRGSTKDEHSLFEGIWSMHCCVIDLRGNNQKSCCKVQCLRVGLRGTRYGLINLTLSCKLI